MQALKYSSEGRTIYYAGDLGNEHIGSMMGHIARLGIEPAFAALADSEDLSSSAIVLIHLVLSPQELQNEWSQKTPLVELSLPSPEFKVPVSFWSFRRRLFDLEDHIGLTYDTWVMDDIWRFYAGG